MKYNMQMREIKAGKKRRDKKCEIK